MGSGWTSRRSFLLVLALASAALATPADDLLAQARAYAAEQSWHLAVRDYTAFCERYRTDPRAPQVGLDALEALAKVHQLRWQYEDGPDAELRAACDAYVRLYAGTLWELRGQRRRHGLLYGTEEDTARLVARCRELLGDHPTLAWRRELAEALLLTDGRGGEEARVRARGAYLEAAGLQAGLDVTARAWGRLANLANAAAPFDDEPMRGEEAAGWWLRIVREAGQTASASSAWRNLIRRAERQGDYALARDRCYAALQARLTPDGRRVIKDTIARLERPAASADWVTHSSARTASLPCVITGRNAREVTLTLTQAGRAQPLRRWTVAAPPTPPYAPWELRQSVALPGAGRYSLSASVAGQSPICSDAADCSDLALLCWHDGREAIVQATDRRDWRPLVGVDLTISLRHEQRPPQVRTGRTGADGVWRAAWPLTDEDDGHVEITARWAGQTAWVTDTWRGPEPPDAPADGLFGPVNFDRTTYRPGQTVHFAAVLRRIGPPVSVARNQTLAVTVSSPGGEVTPLGQLSTDADGIVHGEWQVPAAATLGSYTLVLGDEESGASGEFSVEEYRARDLQVSVTTPSRVVQPGQTQTVVIRATEPSGRPLAGAKVDYSVVSGRLRPSLERSSLTARWRQEFDHDAGEWAARQDEISYEQEVHYRRGTATTDSAGEARVQVTTQLGPRDTCYNLRADVTDGTRRQVTGSGGFVASAARALLWSGLDRAAYRPGEQVTAACRAQDPSGQPTACSARATLYRLEFQPAARRLTPDWRTYPRFERGLPVWSNRPVTLDAGGETTFAFDAPGSGCYQLVIEADAAPGSLPAVTASTFHCVDETVDHPYPLDRVLVLPDRREHLPGGTARLMVMAPARGMSLLVRRVDARGPQPVRTVHLSGNQGWIELNDLYVAGEAAQVVAAGARPSINESTELLVRPGHGDLRVRLASDAASYPARGQGRLTVETTDAAGRPVAARVIVSAANQLALDLRQTDVGAPDWAAPERPYFGPVDACASYGTGERGWSEQDERAMMNLRVIGMRLVRPGQQGDDCASVIELPSMGISSLSSGLYGSISPDFGQQPRRDLPDTLLWKPAVTTGADGRAVVPFTLPDSLTTWAAGAIATRGVDGLAGATTTFTSTKDLLVRLIAPPRVVQGDEPVISAVATQAGERPQRVTARLQADHGRWLSAAEAPLELDAHGSSRLDARLRCDQPGRTLLTASVAGASEQDALELPLTVEPGGIAVADGRSAVARAGQPGAVDLTLPACLPGSARLTVQVGASRIATLLDAARRLKEVDADGGAGAYAQAAAALAKDATAKLNAYAGPAAQPEPPPAEPKGGGLKSRGVYGSVVSDLGAPMGLTDGGVPWYPGLEPDPSLSAFVAEALLPSLAVDPDGPWPHPLATRQLDFAAVPPARGTLTTYLERWIRRANDASDTTADAMWVVDQVLARRLYRADPAEHAIVLSAAQRLWAGRERLSDASLARLGQVLARRGDARSATVWRNLEARAVVSGGAASWGVRGDPVAATAIVLQAALQLAPTSPLVDQAAEWLLLNRGGSRWRTVVASARALGALTEWSKSRREAAEPARLTLTIDGQLKQTWNVAAADVPRFGDTVTVNDLVPGRHRVELARAGQGTAYLSAELTWLSAEQPIVAAGDKLTIAREWRLVTGDQTEPLPPDRPVPVGALVEVGLTLNSTVPLDCVRVIAPTPAGFRADDTRSNWRAGSIWCYSQVRERTTELAIGHLRQGRSEVSYRLRAEAPGRYRALPVEAEALLAAGVRGRSGEQTLTIVDEGSAQATANGQAEP